MLASRKLKNMGDGRLNRLLTENEVIFGMWQSNDLSIHKIGLVKVI